MIGDIDKKYAEKGFRVIGVDEAGRGPLCGPVVTAAVSLCCDIPGLNDSKQLSEKRRLELLPLIVKNSVWSLWAVRPEVIDKLNILNATLLGMARCANKVISRIRQNHIVIIDGNKLTKRIDNEISLVKGDALSVNIAAASILAKCFRDRVMMRLDELYPEYHLASHKGYPTEEHYEILRKIGPCEIYRKSFRLFKEKEPEQLDLF